jgi:hypothetical protein
MVVFCDITTDEYDRRGKIDTTDKDNTMKSMDLLGISIVS